MAFQNIKRNGINFTVESADELNQMTEKVDKIINSYETKELEYRFRNITYWKSGYKIDRLVVLNGKVQDGQKIPWAPVGRNQYFTGTDNSSGKQYVVEVTTKGRINIRSAPEGTTVTVMGQWIV